MNDNQDTFNQPLAPRTEQIEAILSLDQQLQQIVRTGWAQSWLQLNMPIGSIRALFALEGGQVKTPGGVADLLGISRTTITSVLDRLENEGLIARTIDPADRRSFVLTLTETGQRLLRQVDTSRREPISKALELLTPEQLVALYQGFTALVEAMLSQRQASIPVEALSE